jgi:hypothetical protein
MGPDGTEWYDGYLKKWSIQTNTKYINGDNNSTQSEISLPSFTECNSDFSFSDIPYSNSLKCL